MKIKSRLTGPSIGGSVSGIEVASPGLSRLGASFELQEQLVITSPTGELQIQGDMDIQTLDKYVESATSENEFVLVQRVPEEYGPTTLTISGAAGLYDAETGVISRVSDGTVDVEISTPFLTIKKQVELEQVAGGLETYYATDLSSGSFAKATLDKAIALTSATGKEWSAWDSLDTADSGAMVAVRNPEFYAASVDWTGVSIRGKGALVGPKTLLASKHIATTYLGSVVAFLGSDDEIVSRTVVASYDVSGTDIRLCVLDEDVPETVSWYKVLPRVSTTLNDFWPARSTGSPHIVNDRAPLFCIAWEQGRAVYGNSPGLVTPYYLHMSEITLDDRFILWKTNLFGAAEIASQTDISDYTLAPRGGDSGEPVFVIPGDEPVLLGCWWTSYNNDTGGQVPRLEYEWAALSSWLTANGGNQFTEADLSAYNDYS